MSETAFDLQLCRILQFMESYCEDNQNKGILKYFQKVLWQKHKFLYNGITIENVKGFLLFGYIPVKSGKLNNTKKHLTKQVSKACCDVLRKICYFNLPINRQLDLFDEAINPILLLFFM